MKPILILTGMLLPLGLAMTIGAERVQHSPPPRIEEHGKVIPFPEAREQPRDDSKIVVDLTASGPVDQPHPALDKVARYVNLYSSAGKTPARVHITVVMHGEATLISLEEEVYGKHFSTKTNPHLELIRKLKTANVEFLVCGQALSGKGFSSEHTAPEVDVAVSALTAIVNRQQEGYAYIPLMK